MAGKSPRSDADEGHTHLLTHTVWHRSPHGLIKINVSVSTSVAVSVSMHRESCTISFLIFTKAVSVSISVQMELPLLSISIRHKQHHKDQKLVLHSHKQTTSREKVRQKHYHYLPPLLNCSLKPVMLTEMSVAKMMVTTLEVEVMGESLGTRPQNLPAAAPLVVSPKSSNIHSQT